MLSIASAGLVGAEVVQRGIQLVHALHVGEPWVQLGKDEQCAAHFLQQFGHPEIRNRYVTQDRHSNAQWTPHPPSLASHCIRTVCIMVQPLCQHLAMSHGSGIIATEEVHVGVRALHIPVYLLKCLVVLQA
jgi:hypothetical protein